LLTTADDGTDSDQGADVDIMPTMSGEDPDHGRDSADQLIDYQGHRYKVDHTGVYKWGWLGGNVSGTGGGFHTWIAVTGPVAATVAAVAREALRQHGATRREEIRQSHETTRTALTGRLPDTSSPDAAKE